MKTSIALGIALLLAAHPVKNLYSQESTTIVAPSSEVADGLDLNAVAEIFKETKNLEEFEKEINDPKTGVNNLDLDGDDQVDYIRVVEEVADDTHVIILQVQLSEKEYQDVATIEVEKSGEEYNMQVRGNEVVYGPDYYIAPTVVHVHPWPVFGWIFRPVYRPYRSPFYFGVYPRWWRPYRPVTVNIYRTRTAPYARRGTFRVTRTSRVTTVHRVNYKPRTSTVVRKRSVTRTRTNTAGKRTTVKASRTKVTNPKTGKTRTKTTVKRTKTTKHKGKRTTVKKKQTKVSKKGKSVKRTTKTKKRTRRH